MSKQKKTNIKENFKMYFTYQRFKGRGRNHREETWHCDKEQVEVKKKSKQNSRKEMEREQENKI